MTRNYDPENLAGMSPAHVLKLARDGHLDELIDPGVTERRAEQEAAATEAEQTRVRRQREAAAERGRAREAAIANASPAVRQHLNRTTH